MSTCRNWPPIVNYDHLIWNGRLTYYWLSGWRSSRRFFMGISLLMMLPCFQKLNRVISLMLYGGRFLCELILFTALLHLLKVGNFQLTLSSLISVLDIELVKMQSYCILPLKVSFALFILYPYLCFFIFVLGIYSLMMVLQHQTKLHLNQCRYVFDMIWCNIFHYICGTDIVWLF